MRNFSEIGFLIVQKVERRDRLALRLPGQRSVEEERGNGRASQSRHVSRPHGMRTSSTRRAIAEPAATIAKTMIDQSAAEPAAPASHSGRRHAARAETARAIVIPAAAAVPRRIVVIRLLRGRPGSLPLMLTVVAFVC